MPSLCNDLCEKKVISAILRQKKSLRIQFTAGRSMLSVRIEAELLCLVFYFFVRRGVNVMNLVSSCSQ